jgi:hypothetical protein
VDAFGATSPAGLDRNAVFKYYTGQQQQTGMLPKRLSGRVTPSLGFKTVHESCPHTDPQLVDVCHTHPASPSDLGFALLMAIMMEGPEIVECLFFP